MSRFAPTDDQARASVLASNERAERLAARIVAAERAVKSGQPSTVVLALLGGAEEPETAGSAGQDRVTSAATGTSTDRPTPGATA